MSNEQQHEPEQDSNQVRILGQVLTTVTEEKDTRSLVKVLTLEEGSMQYNGIAVVFHEPGQIAKYKVYRLVLRPRDEISYDLIRAEYIQDIMVETLTRQRGEATQ